MSGVGGLVVNFFRIVYYFKVCIGLYVGVIFWVVCSIVSMYWVDVSFVDR